MKKYIYLALMVSFLATSCEDDPIMMDPEPDPIPTPCEMGRYTSPDFTSQNVTTVKFGEGELALGIQDLLMDIYTPVGDSLTDRPLIILAFGGAFITGDRSQMEDFARYFTSHGYVVASIDYRLFSGFLPTNDALLDTAVKAMHDVKAAVRYMRNEALTDNLYGIDPDNIIVGGLSAGAIASLQAAYFDEEDLAMADAAVQAAITNNGGIEGTSNDLDVSSEVVGVLSFSGGMYALDWIDAGEPWVVSVHGDEDIVVPYETGMVNVGLPIDFTLSGSGAMVPRLEETGVEYSLWTVAGGGHVDIYIEDDFEQERTDFQDFVIGFLVDKVCE
jgi:dienelactone hydrolase